MSSFLNSLNIAGSALTAERFRMDIISQNLANVNTTRTADGDPYRRKQVVFEERPLDFAQTLRDAEAKAKNGGVQVREVVESEEDFVPVYDPQHPHADENGYVWMPNVDRAEEMVDLMSASNAYTANLTALNVIKSMTSRALDLGR